MRIVVIGATSAIAEHCCRLWVTREVCDLVLVARDVAKAGRVAEDLRVRSPASTITVVETDFLDTAAIGRLAAEAAARPIDIVLIAHGVLPEQSLCENDLLVCRDTLEVNAVSPALFAEAFAGYFAKAGRGTLAIIGSVAADGGCAPGQWPPLGVGRRGGARHGARHRRQATCRLCAGPVGADHVRGAPSAALCLQPAEPLNRQAIVARQTGTKHAVIPCRPAGRGPRRCIKSALIANAPT